MTTLPERECDMILKGGITSGVVYPLAATHLAQTYRFRNLGGASAGAIAAAMVAAAELGRRNGHDGFAELENLPSALGRDLQTLFQPSPAIEPTYRLLLTCVDRKAPKRRKVGAVLLTAIRAVPWLCALTFVLALLPGLGIAVALGRGNIAQVVGATLLWLPAAAVIALSVALVAWFKATRGELTKNGFGMCDGHTRTDPSHPPLTDWLHHAINRAAGRPESGAPVTFGDLWGTRAVDEFNKQVPPGTRVLDLPPHQRRQLAALRLTSLEVMTTNLTLRRPYLFPFEGREFFFCPRCLASYFPDEVIAAMTASTIEVPDKARAAATGGTLGPISTICPQHAGTRVRYFPRPPDIPIVVAARLSLSFPMLISAIPLYYIDYARAPQHVAMVPVWFSDGGIASNFPMHLFDAPWPGRPTFGIDLQPADELHGDQHVYLPKSAAPRSHAIGSIGEFVSALFDTMHNWVDITQLTLPAYRGRVAEIRLEKGQGGLNIDMPADLVRSLAEYGRQAATLFDVFDLPHHQQVRFEASMAAIDDLVTALHDSSVAGFASTVNGAAPAARRVAAQDLIALGAGWATDHPGARGDIPHPTGDLRIVPRQ